MKAQTLDQAAIMAEYELITEALKKTGHNKAKAAELLKIDRKTLYNKIKRYKDVVLSTETQN